MNNEIVIIGISHYDPLGRDKIVTILQNLKSEIHFVPDAIAVEWDETHHIRVVKQRDKFRAQIEKQFCHLNKNQIETLTQSLGYEADSHHDIFPNIPVIWLDEGREDKDDALDTYAFDRISIVKRFYPDNTSPKEFLTEISKNVWACIDINSPPKSLSRDQNFFQLTCNALNNGHHKIVSIVGAAHSNDMIEGVYANLLKKAGYKVSTFILD